jgi:hypothetical protein
MLSRLLRSTLIAVALLGLLLVSLAFRDTASAQGDTIPPVAPNLQNGSFECANGFYSTTNPAGERVRLPGGWQAAFLNGAPETNSTRREVTRACDNSTSQHIERLEGLDSWIIKAQHIESSPEPGKPFDFSFYQQITATPGGAYSLSGWMLTLCGGSTTPNDCPEGYYMAKLLGIDPTGGVDPLAETVIWAEDRRNFVEGGQRVGWTNLYTVAVAQAPTITLFARINSPFQWHGNHAFVDAVTLVRAPTARLNMPTVVTGTELTVTWASTQSSDLLSLPGGNYRLYIDIEHRRQGLQGWQTLVRGAEASGEQSFRSRCPNVTHEFRIRARAEQPEGQPGAFPTQRYPGQWSQPVPVRFQDSSSVNAGGVGRADGIFLPLVAAFREC